MENFANIFNIDGIENDYRAERDATAAEPKIVVRDYHGIVAFVLPDDTTVEQINRAVSIYEQGFRGGEQHGESTARAKLMKALNLDPTNSATWACGNQGIDSRRPAVSAAETVHAPDLNVAAHFVKNALLISLVTCLSALAIDCARDWIGVSIDQVDLQFVAGVTAGMVLPKLFKWFVKV